MLRHSRCFGFHQDVQAGLVEYRFQPDAFEVCHVWAAGQLDVGLDSLLRGSQMRGPRQ